MSPERVNAPGLCGLVLLFMATSGCGQSRVDADGERRSTGPIEHVIVVSVDGLMPESYLRPDERQLKVPTLRNMFAAGSHSTGVESILPSVTYPAHTSIVTGVNPAQHGITTNRSWDPMGLNQEGWRWYAEDLRTPTLWDAAHAAGLKTASVQWPVTVGANIDFLMPEYWRAGTEDDFKLLRALSTPELLDRATARFPDLPLRYKSNDVADDVPTDVAVDLIEREKPHLLLLHLWQVDEMQHGHGVWTESARAAIEKADQQINRLIRACQKAGIWDRSALIVLSDHGFRDWSGLVHLDVMLRNDGLVELTTEPKPAIKNWVATTIIDGGFAYVYIRDPKDLSVKRKVDNLFRSRANKPGSGIGRVFSTEEIREAGGDPKAFLAVEAAEGYAFQRGFEGDRVIAEPTTTWKGTHGWHPAHPDMKASFMAYGPPIVASSWEGGKLIDVAPTVADWLRLSLPNVEGAPLPIKLRKSGP